jgi:hypothetical protein
MADRSSGSVVTCSGAVERNRRMADAALDMPTAGGAADSVRQGGGALVRGVAVPGLPACELRWERPVLGDPGDRREIVCLAAAGKRLALVGAEAGAMRAACGSCPIPREMAWRPCLYLVPFKTERDGRPRDYFACRWFYLIKPEAPATSTASMCGGCPYWFPRPPVEMLRDLPATTGRIVQHHQDAWAGRLPPSPLGNWVVSWPDPKPQRRGVLRRLVRWICSGAR